MDEDQLREAISRVRIAKQEVLSAKEVHAALQQESAWRQLTLSEVKRTSSKMAKQAAAGATATQSSGSQAAATSSSPVFGVSLGERGSVRPGGLPAELATAPPTTVKCCAVCGKSDVPLKTCERCVRDGLTGIRICSQQCWESVWPQHKKQHKRLRMVHAAEAMVGPVDANWSADYEERLKLAREGSNEYEAHISAAKDFERKRNYKKAEKALRRAIALEPANPLSYFELARIHGRQANIRGAVQAYEDCIRRCDPTSVIFADSLALHFSFFNRSRQPPKPQEGANSMPPAPSFDDCLINEETGDLGPPPTWWNRPGLIALSALALDIQERIEQGAVPIPAGYSGRNTQVALLHMRASVLSAFPRAATFTLHEIVVPPPKDMREAARCMSKAATFETDPSAREKALAQARNLRRAVASPQFAQLREATLHFAENPESNQTFYMDALDSDSEDSEGSSGEC